MYQFTFWGMSNLSIHALVKRATVYRINYIKYHVLSIHALVKRATLNYNDRRLQIQSFNPRPREEGDRKEESVT